MTWIDVDGLCNLRDLGGTPTQTRRVVRAGRLLRSDNLQDLTGAGRQALLGLGLTDVIDLRSTFEIEHAPSPLANGAGVRYHHHSFFPEHDPASLNERALPWVGQVLSVSHADPVVASYLSFLADRPDSVVGALRAIAAAHGAALVHCAAGKDRTGVTVALALALVGVADDDIAADYERTTERILAVVQRMADQDTYASSVAHVQPFEALRARPEVIVAVLDTLRDQAGGVEEALMAMGWTPGDTERLAARLLD